MSGTKRWKTPDHIFSGTCTGRFSLSWHRLSCSRRWQTSPYAQSVGKWIRPYRRNGKHRKNFRLAAYRKSFTRRPAQYGIFGHNDYDRKWAVLCYRNRYEYANWENRRYAFTRTGTADTSYQAPQSYRKSAWHPGPDYLCHSIFPGIAEKSAGFWYVYDFRQSWRRSHSGKSARSCHHHAKPWCRAHGKTVCRYPPSPCCGNTWQCFCYLFWQNRHAYPEPHDSSEYIQHRKWKNLTSLFSALQQPIRSTRTCTDSLRCIKRTYLYGFTKRISGYWRNPIWLNPQADDNTAPDTQWIFSNN